jgi:hypothetical protein
MITFDEGCAVQRFRDIGKSCKDDTLLTAGFNLRKDVARHVSTSPAGAIFWLSLYLTRVIFMHADDTDFMDERRFFSLNICENLFNLRHLRANYKE